MISAFLNRYSTQFIVASIISLIAAVLAFSSVTTLRGIIDDTAKRVESGRDAHWRGEIANAEVIAAKNIVAQLKASQVAQEKALAEITRLKNQVSQLEDANAALSDTPGSGIDIDRTRLLNNQFLGGKAYSPY